jgi:UDP-glucose 4-epimerase
MSAEYKRKNILITGIAGLLGSHMAKHLVNKGHKVFGIDNLSGGYIENVPAEAKFHKVDLLNHEAVGSIIKDNDINVIYHFAAYAAVGLSPFIRRFNYQNNILASVNLINESIKNNIDKFIFSSSMDVYGAQEPPFTEDMTPLPLDPYGIAKYAIELDLKNAYSQFGLDYTIIRPHNIIGPHQNIWDRYRNVAGIWIRQAMAGEQLTIYGDGQQRRAFSDVKYYLEPFESLIWNTETTGQTINIGADQDISINDLANIVQDVAHERLHIRPVLKYLEARDEVKHMWCNHDKAKSMLDFSDNTDIYSLIKETWDWAVQITPKPVKYMEYEINKGIYSYWRNNESGSNKKNN